MTSTSIHGCCFPAIRRPLYVRPACGRSRALAICSGAAKLACLPRVWLVDCPMLYDRVGGPYHDQHGNEWHDNALRFALLNHVAALIGGGLAGDSWRPDVVHGQDWHAALLAARARPRPATLLTVHNLAYQGLFQPDQFD